MYRIESFKILRSFLSVQNPLDVKYDLNIVKFGPLRTIINYNISNLINLYQLTEKIISNIYHIRSKKNVDQFCKKALNV